MKECTYNTTSFWLISTILDRLGRKRLVDRSFFFHLLKVSSRLDFEGWRAGATLIWNARFKYQVAE